MECVLSLSSLVVDEIRFNRLGLKNDNDFEFSFSINIGVNKSDPTDKRVTVRITGAKKDEYSLEIAVSGFFYFEGDANDEIVTQNAVAIVMPYIRSQLTLLTSQPGMEPVVLPPFNIVELLKQMN